MNIQKVMKLILKKIHEMREILKKFNKNIRHKDLIVIKVKDENSVPLVIYKGGELKSKRVVKFLWVTRNGNYEGGYDINIEHYAKSEKGRPGRYEKSGFRSLFFKEDSQWTNCIKQPSSSQWQLWRGRFGRLRSTLENLWLVAGRWVTI